MHLWRPPFGLDRVGKPITAVVEVHAEQRPIREFYLTSLRDGHSLERHVLNLSGAKTIFSDSTMFQTYPDELVLSAKCRFQGEETELLRYPVKLPDFEADASARPDMQINPVDLGTILVPSDWLLLKAGQKAIVKVAAISYQRSITNGKLSAYFESSHQPVDTVLNLAQRTRAQIGLSLGPIRAGPDKDILHVVAMDADGRELWHKRIPTMFVAHPPEMPSFGAIAEKLRYDAPISVRDTDSGRLSGIDYNDAWNPSLKDVVVALPNGSRFVFWRGSSYIPFWAGQHNTGFSYEWAETTPPPDGFVDSVEPLMDKELRYGRVEILESTVARVRVRWTYQSTDFNYKVWGDEATEDFTFYPDGFGTRTLSLKSIPGADYELSEFIVLTSQSTYPLEVFPKNIAELVYLDGAKQEISFPYHPPPGAAEGFQANKIENARGVPVIYRLHMHKDDAATPIYFYPGDLTMPIAYSAFYDRGYLVTPAYWGSHWPLGRGKSTGFTIDDRVYSNPGHNSFLTWGMSNRPIPMSTSRTEMIDTLGKSKTMTIQRWSWLIANTDMPDNRLIEWAQSFSHPPSVEIAGGRLDFDSYDPERRAIRIAVEKPAVEITLTPIVSWIDPVFEITSGSSKLLSVSLDSRPLPANGFAWDGHTLWIKATIDKPTCVTLLFS